MAVINRKFYQSWRGPTPSDQESWSMVFDTETRHLVVRHEWQISRHDGCDDLELAEFLQESGSAQEALVDSLFRVPVDV